MYKYLVELDKNVFKLITETANAGTRLATYDVIGQKFDVSRDTIARSVRRIEAGGLIEVHRAQARGICIVVKVVSTGNTTASPPGGTLPRKQPSRKHMRPGAGGFYDRVERKCLKCKTKFSALRQHFLCGPCRRSAQDGMPEGWNSVW